MRQPQLGLNPGCRKDGYISECLVFDTKYTFGESKKIDSEEVADLSTHNRCFALKIRASPSSVMILSMNPCARGVRSGILRPRVGREGQLSGLKNFC